VDVAGVGDRDSQRVPLEGVGHPDHALEHVRGNLPRRLLRDAGQRQVDEGQLKAAGEGAR
jgi:hypothetical protein